MRVLFAFLLLWPAIVMAAPIDTASMQTTVMALSEALGPRPAGSIAEQRAARWLVAEWKAAGLAPRLDTFSLAAGGASVNVTAIIPGRRSGKRVIIGAHYDSHRRSPGADDNASGVAALGELARQWRHRPPPLPVELAAFGAEERCGPSADHRHQGSRHRASRIADSTAILAMLSLDMLGAGPEIAVHYHSAAGLPLARSLAATATRLGLKPVTVLREGVVARSDHDPFDALAVPAVWIERRPAPARHTAADRAANVRPERIAEIVELVMAWLEEKARR